MYNLKQTMNERINSIKKRKPPPPPPWGREGGFKEDERRGPAGNTEFDVNF